MRCLFMRRMQNSFDLSCISNPVVIHLRPNVVHRSGKEKNSEGSLRNGHAKYKSVWLCPMKIIITVTQRTLSNLLFGVPPQPLQNNEFCACLVPGKPCSSSEWQQPHLRVKRQPQTCCGWSTLLSNFPLWFVHCENRSDLQCIWHFIHWEIILPVAGL